RMEEAAHRRDELEEAYGAYLAQQAIVELTESSAEELDRAEATAASLRRQVEEDESREAGLQASAAKLAPGSEAVAALAGQLAEAELRAADWRQRFELAAAALDLAERNRVELRHLQERV